MDMLASEYAPALQPRCVSRSTCDMKGNDAAVCRFGELTERKGVFACRLYWVAMIGRIASPVLATFGKELSQLAACCPSRTATRTLLVATLTLFNVARSAVFLDNAS